MVVKKTASIMLIRPLSTNQRTNHELARLKRDEFRRQPRGPNVNPVSVPAMRAEMRYRNGFGCPPHDGRGKPRIIIAIPRTVREKANPTPTTRDRPTSAPNRDNDST
jgi:hypothetical protein